ncbi:MAG: hypothetical protein JXA57_20345 [Armatimonadetes bacterium]|nr:hypothetical protein [Armatimonadota bacterium]
MIARKSSRHTQIGIDRLIRLEWLEKAANLVLAGNDRDQSKTILQEQLKGSFRSKNARVRGSIDKTITILLRVWLSVPRAVEHLRIAGLDLHRETPAPHRIALHWGMIMAVYPFWAAVARHVGRHLRLQGTVTAAHVQRRVREEYGERETVSRRVRYVLRSFLNWGVLVEAETQGVYQAAKPIPIEDPRLLAWLLEASLHAHADGSALAEDLFNSGSLFPFQLTPISTQELISTSPRLECLHRGIDADVIGLKATAGPQRLG